MTMYIGRESLPEQISLLAIESEVLPAVIVIYFIRRCRYSQETYTSETGHIFLLRAMSVGTRV
jgi:hypothetical protein